jgi:septum formation protein
VVRFSFFVILYAFHRALRVEINTLPMIYSRIIGNCREKAGCGGWWRAPDATNPHIQPLPRQTPKSQVNYVRILGMLVLASNSPRRRQLLRLAGWSFQVSPAEIDESPLPEENPGSYVSRLACQKAISAATQAPADSVILAADTAVVEGDEILGKPSSPSEAVEILERLRGRLHQVFTAIALIKAGDEAGPINQVCTTGVYMRNYSDEEIQHYVASGDPMDKAGAYAIQNRGFDPVEHLDGCFTNVMGLPLCYLYRALEKLGESLPPGVVPLCQAAPPDPCQFRQDLLTNFQ